jgi:1-deoxy-D-xylulose-5-phosphate synthase
MILERINQPNDIKNLNWDELDVLAAEIREFLVQKVSENGGHLASNLGVVELTIAMHMAYDLPKDKMIFDVGHQAYTHKIITGRRESFSTLRKQDGITGFPCHKESEYDVFDAGHSSTAISSALGLARARDCKNENYNVIALVRDGAIGGGMALEALNDTGSSPYSKLIIILNL